MKNLQEATEKICDLKGSLLTVQALLNALIQVLPVERLPSLQREFEQQIEAGKAVLLGGAVSDQTIDAMTRDAQLLSSSLRARMEEMGIRPQTR